MPEYEFVISRRQDAVALITLNRPDRLNAMHEALNRDLLAALQEAAGDPAVRAVLITGAGKSFCAGADLSVFAGEMSDDQIYDFILSNYLPMMQTIMEMPKPVLAAVNGVAAGAGASLALACDLRVMAHDATLMMAFSNVGLVPDAGATWLLTRLTGYSRAYEMAIEGQRISAEHCLHVGLTNRLAPAAQLDEISLAWALKLAERPTLALGLTKQAMQFSQLNDLAAAIKNEARLQKQTIPSHDFEEGVAAFLAKRDPEFLGK